MTEDKFMSMKRNSKKLLHSKFYILHSRGGQSILEILIAVGVGAILMIAAVTIIAPALKINTQAARAQAAGALGKALLENVRAWSEGDWHNIQNLATTSANLYYLNTTSSRFTTSTGVESVVVSTTTYKRFFYVDNVQRDTSSPYNIVTSGGSDDPSTKKITIGYNWPQGTTTTYSIYLTRNRNKAYSQTDWSGGSGQNGPATTTNSRFTTSTNVSYTENAGSIQVSLPVFLGITTSTAATSTTCVTNFIAHTNAGEILIVVTNWDNQSATASVSDTRGNTYTSAVGPTNVTSDGFAGRMQVFFVNNVSPGAVTTTVTYNASVNPWCYSLRYSGVSKQPPLDVVSSATGNVSQTPSSGTSTMNSSHELIFGWALAKEGFASPYAGDGFTMRLHDVPSAGPEVIIEDKKVTSQGNYSAFFAASNLWDWGAQMATFRISNN
ncbi:MAG: hypothetical protein Q7R94_01095 [bacterium]|nr:hypothetical protein [bacterium]